MIDLLRRGFGEEITPTGLTAELRRHANTVESDDVEHLATVLDGFLASVPDALACAIALSKDRRCGHAVAFATGSVFNYIFDEEDLLPEASFGTLGLLDDAYLVHGFVATLRQTFPYVEPSTTSYDAPDARTFEVVASLLPDGVAQSLQRTCESTVQVAGALFPAVHDADAVGMAVEPAIRVAEAVRVTTAAAVIG